LAVVPLERLTAEDARILALESARVAGHTCKVLRLAPGAELDLAALRAHVGPRLAAAPRLRQRLAPTPLGLAPPAWIDDDRFDLARHVRRLAAGGPVDDARLREIVAALMAERLDRAHPLWTLDAVEAPDGTIAALVWKLHHCMADGSACMRLGAEVLWDDGAEAHRAPAGGAVAGTADTGRAHVTADRPDDGWRPAPAPGSARLLAAALRYRGGAAAGDAAGALRAALSPRAWARAGGEAMRLPGTVARELRRAGGDDPLDHAIGTRRTVAFAALPLEDLRRVGHAQPGHVTINDVLLALVGGGLRRWMAGHGAEPHALRVQVPVSLHDRDAHPEALANRDSFICVGLPLGEADPVARLRAINAATVERKRRHDAETLDALFGALRHAGRPLARFAGRLAGDPGTFALSVSDVPGPPAPRWVAGARVERMLSLAEIGERHALRVTALSYAGTLGVGLCADPGAVEDLDALTAGIADEARALLAA
jgi:diacylglycerol O-acyltransferase / wax synthase